MNQTKLLFPLIFISLEDDSSIVIPPQPTSPGEIMSGGDGEPVEADEPEEGENDTTPAETEHTISGVLASTETVTHEYLTQNGKVARETIKTNNSLTAVLDFIYDESGKPFALKYSTDGATFDTYYYVLNLQGDVVKLIQANGHVVAQYIYDAWGNLLDSGGNLLWNAMCCISVASGYFRMVWNRSLFSVITPVGRKFVAHLHPAGAFAPDQECTC